MKNRINQLTDNSDKFLLKCSACWKFFPTNAAITSPRKSAPGAFSYTAIFIQNPTR